MGISKFNNINISAISACVPKNIHINSEHPYLFTDKEKKRLIKTVGIKERRIASSDITASDLGYNAAKDIFDKGVAQRSDIKGVVFLSQTPDYKIPFTSNILQSRLSLYNDCTCIDINAGCSGFITGLQTAFSLVNGFKDGKVLFIVAETCSKFVSQKDKATSLLFGDGAAALIIEKSDKQIPSYFSSYSDGKNSQAIMIPEGGYRTPFSSKSLDIKCDEDGSERNGLELDMNGPAVFDFTMREVGPSVKEMQEFSGKKNSEIDFFIFHQANKLIINQLAIDLDMCSEKIPINIDKFGNTSGVSIPLVIVTELRDEPFCSGYIQCIGYGAGLSWGNVVFDVSKTIILPLIEI